MRVGINGMGRMGSGGHCTPAGVRQHAWSLARLVRLAGILGFEARPLVSADYCNDSRSAIVDGPSTTVTDGTLLKVYAWYDNEIGYVCRMVDLANIVIRAGAA